ncbi:MAG: four-carbon acid sugar kinase family protein [Treponema sp.]|jgi:uncharacterized protein YgbK (DUF1537 family)|nr:four-carbon acid sugar kinase family protein [Treponema sp.]
MATLLVLADDLTGALDTGVQFAKNGIEVRVLASMAAAGKSEKFSGGSGRINAAEQAEALVINTDTRRCSPAEAEAVITRCLKKFAGIPYVYKKTDSTLRGNIGAELEALAENGPQKTIPFIPAYPDLGRTTKGGHHFVNGIPLDKTESAFDALNPVTHSFIPGIITEESSIPVRIIPLGEKPAYASNSNSTAEIVIFDCNTNDDMRNIAAALKRADLLHATAGCAGFAEALLGVIPFPEEIRTAKANKAKKVRIFSAFPYSPIPLLFVSGSRHPVSIGQIKAAMDKGVGGIPVEGKKLCSPEWLGGGEAVNLVKDCAGQLRKKGACILGTAESFGTKDGSTTENTSTEDAGNGISKGLGQLVKNIIEETGHIHAAVFGGDTLLGIMEALGFDSIVPIDEIRPGIVHAMAGNLSIAAKSGAFGEPDIIEIIIDFFHGPAS